jgi:malate dehydrogenase (oxaloacetate-decarboxylating)
MVTDEERSAEYIIPSVFDPRVVDAVAKAVGSAAVDEGVARRALVKSEEEEIDAKV